MNYRGAIAFAIVFSSTLIGAEPVCPVIMSCPNEGEVFSRAFCFCDTCANVCRGDGNVMDCSVGCKSFCDKQSDETAENKLCFELTHKPDTTKPTVKAIPHTPQLLPKEQDLRTGESRPRDEQKESPSVLMLVSFSLIAVLAIISIILGVLSFHYRKKLRKQQNDVEDPLSASSTMLPADGKL